MTTLSKGIMGVAGASAGTGLAAVGAYKFGSSEELKTISSLLSSENKDKRKLAKSTDGAEDGWKEAGKAYRENFNSTGKDPFSLSPTKGTSPVNLDNATQEFMGACETQETKKVKDSKSEDYQLFLQYCTRDTLMSDLVKESGRKALVKSETESSDAKGVKVWDEYKKHNTVKTAQSDHGKLNDGANKSSANTVPVSFMNKCDSELNRAYYDVNGDDFKKVMDWCTDI